MHLDACNCIFLCACNCIFLSNLYIVIIQINKNLHSTWVNKVKFSERMKTYINMLKLKIKVHHKNLTWIITFFIHSWNFTTSLNTDRKVNALRSFLQYHDHAALPLSNRLSKPLWCVYFSLVGFQRFYVFSYGDQWKIRVSTWLIKYLNHSRVH